MLGCPFEGSLAVFVACDWGFDGYVFLGALWGLDVEGLGVGGVGALDLYVVAVVGAADPLGCVVECGHVVSVA